MTNRVTPHIQGFRLRLPGQGGEEGLVTALHMLFLTGRERASHAVGEERYDAAGESWLISGAD